MSHLILIAFEQKAFLFLALRLETLDRAFADSKAWQFLFSTLCSYLLVASCLFLLLAKISFSIFFFFFVPLQEEICGYCCKMCKATSELYSEQRIWSLELWSLALYALLWEGGKRKKNCEESQWGKSSNVSLWMKSHHWSSGSVRIWILALTQLGYTTQQLCLLLLAWCLINKKWV